MIVLFKLCSCRGPNLSNYKKEMSLVKSCILMRSNLFEVFWSGWLQGPCSQCSPASLCLWWFCPFYVRFVCTRLNGKTVNSHNKYQNNSSFAYNKALKSCFFPIIINYHSKYIMICKSLHLIIKAGHRFKNLPMFYFFVDDCR